MPQQTYNIGYGKNDFFYNKNNYELLKTIPFTNKSLIKWVNENRNPSDEAIKDNTDIFDENITKVVFNNKYKFINEYLPNNIVINSNSNFSNFESRDIDLNSPPTSNGQSYASALKSGYLTIEPVNEKNPITEIDLYGDPTDVGSSSFEYTTNSVGQMNSDISLNAILSFGETPYPEPNGSTSYISVSTANPRCKFQKGCTEKHWHYKSCKTQKFANQDGTTYCKCVCTGEKTYDDESHDHCSPFNIDKKSVDSKGNVDPIAFQSTITELIKKITVSFKQETQDYSYTGSDGKMKYPYNYNRQLKDTDIKIRTLIYDYYYELNRNIELQKNIGSTNSLDKTTTQALKDANVKYKKEYLQLFNIFSGILFASGYIYVLYKSK